MSKTQQIIDLRRSGMPLKKIAAIVGCDHSYCSQVCRAAGLGGAIIEQRLTESQVANYVSRSGFSYVGGYTMAKAPITVRCGQCRLTFERQFHIFRDVVNGTFGTACECPNCKRIEQDKKRLAKDIQRIERERVAWIKAEQRIIEERARISRQIERRLATRVCKNCGITYTIASTGYDSEKYCSEKCMKRWTMRIKNDRRIKKMQSRKHDTDITLEKLFKRDGGVCYLCGRVCDWKDMVDGNAGDRYPSIDHVVPISKGGTHTWGNIKLACRKCNWKKGDSA